MIVGLEAIDHQDTTKFYDDLVDLLSAYRAKGDFTESTLRSCGLKELVYKYCRATIVPKLMDTVMVNAAINIPQLRHNGVFDRHHGEVDLNKLKTVKGFNGYVDKNKAMLGGEFSNTPVEMYFTKGILQNQSISDKEVAAAALHELGHLYSYFERLADVVKINYEMAEALERFTKVKNEKEKIKLIAELGKGNGVSLPSPEVIASDKSNTTFITAYVTAAKLSRRDSVGNEYYSMRSWEYTSDQFAIRHGAGLALATMISKLSSPSNRNTSLSLALYTLAESFNLMMFVALAAVGPITAPMLALRAVLVWSWLAIETSPSLYDDPKERVDTIRRDLISGLKDKTLSKSRVNGILEDLDEIEKVRDGLTDRDSWTSIIAWFVFPSYRKNERDAEISKRIAKLSNNDLYAAAAKLDNL